MLLTFVTFMSVITAACVNPKMQFVIRAILIYRDVLVSESDPRLLKCHFRGQIVKMNSIVNMCWFQADNHSRGWVVHLLDLTLDCSNSVVIHPLLGALRWCVPDIHED